MERIPMQVKIEDLVTASASGASVLMRRLLAAGADVRGRSSKHGNSKEHGDVTALHTAVKHPVAMRLLLSQPGADPSVRTGGGAEMCPLHFAARGGGFRQEENIKSLRMLISAGGDKEAVDKYNRTPLYFAALCGQHLIARYLLLELFADPEVPGKRGRTAMSAAASGGHAECIVELLKAGARVNTPCKAGTTPLQVACQAGHLDAVKALIAAEETTEGEESIDLEAADAAGRTALHIAAFEGHTAIASALLDAGANIEASDKTRSRPILLAAPNGPAALLRLLLVAEAQVDSAREDGRQAIHEASLHGNLKGLQVLLEFGANPDVADRKGDTPLLSAMRGDGTDHGGLVALLLASGAAPERSNLFTGRTPLFEATQHRRYDLMRQFLESGANPSTSGAPDGPEGGLTPLHVACENCDLLAARMLVAVGAHAHAVTTSDRTTPLHVVCKGSRKLDLAFAQLAHLLLLAGANRQAKDSEGFNCLHHAAASGQAAVVKVLLRSMPPDVRASEVRTPVDNGKTVGLLARELAKKGGHSLVDHILTAAGTEPAILTPEEEDECRKQTAEEVMSCTCPWCTRQWRNICLRCLTAPYCTAECDQHHKWKTPSITQCRQATWALLVGDEDGSMVGVLQG